eukprot:COSAG01_NODE_4047_length_5403_cov_2.337670_9_plen_64_part_00
MYYLIENCIPLFCTVASYTSTYIHVQACCTRAFDAQLCNRRVHIDNSIVHINTIVDHGRRRGS